MATVRIKQHDTRPLDAVLEDQNGPVNLAGVLSVKFLMKPKLSGQGTTVDGDATVVDALAGKVRYAWLSGDVAAAGAHRAEFQVTFADGSVETFPNGDYVDVVILEDLGP